MDASKNINLLVIWMAAIASITLPCYRAQDCHQNPEDCNATQWAYLCEHSTGSLEYGHFLVVDNSNSELKHVLSNFEMFDNVATSDPQPPTYCEKYDRSSLSQDGDAAEYNLVYTEAIGDITIINETSTFEVVNNTRIDIIYASYPGTVYQLTLDYVNGNYCFVGHSNKNKNVEMRESRKHFNTRYATRQNSFAEEPWSEYPAREEYYYLLNHPSSDDSEYNKCLDKIDAYSGGNITFMHGPGICPNVPVKP